MLRLATHTRDVPVFSSPAFSIPVFQLEEAWSLVSKTAMDSFLNWCKRLGFCDNSIPTISDIFSNADDSLFKAIWKNSYHVLYPYLPESQYQHYHLRQRRRNKALIPKTTYLSDRDYHAHAVQELLLAYCHTLLQYCYHPVCLYLLF